MSDQNLKRTLKPRHLIMIALGGSIGTGLFLASGNALYNAGPGSLVLAYLIISIIIYFLMCSLGEMTAHSPTTGSFCEYSSKYVSRGFGFAMGWNYWFNWTLTISTEVMAAALIMQYWFPKIITTVWSVLFFLLIFYVNLMSVKFYGESEYWLSSVKVTFVIIFIVIGISTIIGITGTGDAIGVKNWVVNDAPFHNGFIGFITTLLIAGYSLQGTELIGVAAGEASYPKKSIPIAIKQTFWRLVLFYIFSIGIISFLIPYNSPGLVNQYSDVASSPFTIILENIGFNYAATIMNVVVLIAILSACNASMYSATRIIWHLAKTNQAPKVLSKVNKKGVPINALIATSLVGCIFFLDFSPNNNALFLWLVSASSLSGFIAWFGISLSHYRFRRAYLKQGLKTNMLSYKAKWFPIAPIITMVVITTTIIAQGFDNITNGRKSFLTTYMGCIFFLLLFIGYKLIKKSKLVPLTECDVSAFKE